MEDAKITNKIGSLLVSWDFSHGKNAELVLVGKKKPNGPVEIINAFQGEEARKLYLKLTERKVSQ